MDKKINKICSRCGKKHSRKWFSVRGLFVCDQCDKPSDYSINYCAGIGDTKHKALINKDNQVFNTNGLIRNSFEGD